jgi:hypothetical protein
MPDPRAIDWMQGSRSHIDVSAIACATALLAGCGSDVRATLVALRGGCGLDDIELSELLIVPRGDFPTVEPTEAHGGTVDVPSLPDDVAAITIEGRFEDITEAVGRTARIDRDGDIPVYFAPTEELCAFSSAIDERELGAVGLGPDGDVLLAGGRDRFGLLLDEIVHLRDDRELVEPLSGGLPAATTGLVVVPFGERRFAAIGGARSDGKALDQMVTIDLELPDPVADPSRIAIDDIDHVARAYHAAAVLPNGRVLVSGGCRALDDDSRCVAEAGKVLASSFAIDPQVEGTGVPEFERGPDHIVARYDHQILVARDGVAFAVGGRTVDGRGIVTIERLRPGVFAWERYGPTQDLELETDEAILGAALLEGGLLVVATSLGGVGWVSENAADRWWEPGENTFSWCDGDEETVGCFHDESLAEPPAISKRRLLALPDERVVADAMLLPIGHVGLGPSAAKDLALELPDQLIPPPPSRVGADVLSLADGTMLFAGGRLTSSLELVTPFLLRFRPELVGPDEAIPEVAELQPGSFVAHDPPRFVPVTPTEGTGDERISFDGEALLLQGTSVEEAIPEVWAHVRSFRSASFRFDVTLQATAGGVAHLVLSYGAVARTVLRFGDAVVDGIQRGADGVSTSEFTCSPPVPLSLAEPKRLRFDVTPEKIVIRQSNIEVASCPGIGDAPAALGLGVSGPGNVRASGMRLTRI